MTTSSTPPNIESFVADFETMQAEYDNLLHPRATTPEQAGNLSAVLQIPVEVKAILGSASFPISLLMRMRRGTVLPLDRRVGEAIDLMVNGRVVARGQVVVLEDGAPTLGISLTEIVGRHDTPADDPASMRVLPR